MARVSQARKDEIRNMLLKLVKPGDTVYCILRHVSKLGLTRIIDLYVISKDSPAKPIWISKLVADLLGYQFADKPTGSGIKIIGIGMDMGFHLVYHLSWELFNGIEPPPKMENLGRGYWLKREWL